MPKFKKCPKNIKLPDTNKKLNNKEVVYFFLKTLIFTFTLSITLYIFLSFDDHSSKPSSSCTNKISAKLLVSEDTSSLDIYTSSVKQSANITTDSTIGTKSLYAQFLTLFKFLNSKIYHNKDPFFRKELDHFITVIKPEAEEHIRKLHVVRSEFESYISDFTSKVERKVPIPVNFYRVLIIYFTILKTAYSSFVSSELHSVLSFEIAHPQDNPGQVNVKFIYQQTHFLTVIKTALGVLRVFRQIIYKNLTIGSHNKIKIELSKYIFDNLMVLKDNLFELYNGVVELKYKEEILTVENILKSFKHYKRFLMLNVYVVYLNMFIIGEDYKVVGLEEELFELLSLLMESMKEEFDEGFIDIDIKSGFITTCSDVFVFIKNIKGENIYEFDEGFGDANKECMNLISMFE